MESIVEKVAMLGGGLKKLMKFWKSRPEVVSESGCEGPVGKAVCFTTLCLSSARCCSRKGRKRARKAHWILSELQLCCAGMMDGATSLLAVCIPRQTKALPTHFTSQLAISIGKLDETWAPTSFEGSILVHRTSVGPWRGHKQRCLYH